MSSSDNPTTQPRTIDIKEICKIILHICLFVFTLFSYIVEYKLYRFLFYKRSGLGLE